MADAAAARREARRRRILENSHNRLQFISGKSNEDCSRGSPIKTTITDQDSHKVCVNNGVIVTEQENIESFPSIPIITSLTSDVPVSEGEVVNDLAFSTPRAQETVQTPLFEKLLAHKYDIVILSLFIQFLYSVILVTDDTYFFLPVIIYSLTKMIYFPTKSNSNIANALMLLNHMSSSNIQRVIQVMQTGSFIFADVCIFLFATICIQSLYGVVGDGLIT